MAASQLPRSNAPYDGPLPLSFLEQAEVCREQARDAARLKRFRAALGLFSTAAALCRRVKAEPNTDEATLLLADERLHQIDLESATYTELLNTLSKPSSRRNFG